MPASIDIIPSHRIDRPKWDTCVRYSGNGLIYATSEYLDHTADQWHGIVVNDYDCVMPVPWRKRFGIRYCYNVPFIQQLGWYHLKPVTEPLDLVKCMFSICSYGDYAFNYYNNLSINNGSGGTNYVLRLFRSYEELRRNYHNDLLKNLKSASRQDLVYTPDEYDTAIAVYKDLYAFRVSHVPATAYERFNRLCANLASRGDVIVRKVTSADAALHAIALFLKDERRIYNIMNSTTEEGRKSSANHLLFDAVFREFAGTGFIFDFEGSDIPGVRTFYEKFGAIAEPYQRIHFNNLPLVIRWLKP